MLKRKHLLQAQEATYAKYGKIYTTAAPGVGRTINVMEPEILDHVLRVNFWAYEKDPRSKTTLWPLIGAGIFGADGAHWKWQRKLTSNIFSAKAFRQYTSEVFCREAQTVINYIDKYANSGKVIDLQQLFNCFTLDSFGEIAFGQTFGCLDDPEHPTEFAVAFDHLNHLLAGGASTPFWGLKLWLTGRGKQIAKDSKFVREYALNIIQDRRNNQTSPSLAAKHGNPHQKDLLQLFMDVGTDNVGNVDEATKLSDDMLVDSVLNSLIAGRDTTAQALTWTFYLMHRTQAGPELVQKLVKETEEVLKGEKPTYESTKQQKYAEACFNEALRLYPSVSRNSRICIEDDVLPGGLKVYKGERVAWNLYAMGRATHIWGPDAKEYKPERWMKGSKPSSTKFISFHSGPRTCLGQQFATIEAVTLMSMLIQRFTFELVNPDLEPAYLPSLTLPVDGGLPVRIKRRKETIAV
ncbi:cytochrome P450 [Lobosporangium transversale]|uniref:Cytochrome P450 n=1 Tax=Lobosporangium transversale TaxID=64571 RepID=A0A1Y2GF25_9FUNG|nr:cytochrome P450 [Lobosporangium transversale]ORZ09065.1 cytochrome P450 [Lobosporangium transversale]|eukprot:XP_021878692.1 cytochrome P450 [Lobosporangium transversale]